MTSEDVRRSLEILDNVLAEFDDPDIFPSPSDGGDIVVNGDDPGSPPSTAHDQKERWEDENGNKLEQSDLSLNHCSPNEKLSDEVHPLNSSTDGTTSQHSSSLDESRRCSPPPVPKRSPGTRLSNRDRPFFPKEDYDDSPQVRGSHLSTGSLPLPSRNGEHSSSEVAEGKRRAALSLPTPGASPSSSPVNDNAQINNRLRHVELITDEDRSLMMYLVRDGDDDEAADDEVFFSPPRRVERYVNSKPTSCHICGANLDHRRWISATGVSRDTRKLPMDHVKAPRHAEEHLRRMRLDKKFAKVKLLLETNQVIGLDKPPPSFKPPPPPHMPHKIPLQGDEHSDSQSEKSASGKPSNELVSRQDSAAELSKVRYTNNGKVFPTILNPCDVLFLEESPKRSSYTKDTFCEKSERQIPEKTSNSVGDEPNSSAGKLKEDNLDRDPDGTTTSQNLLPTDVLCKNCINRGWTFRIRGEVAPHSPHSLKRPPLGLSYSMEDDLSPGVKEILDSPPSAAEVQNDSAMSSSKSSPVAHMSTFSHSASSLGDGSSQSDLDFSTSVDSGKVPLTYIKSLTLPTDMKLGPSPFYSAMEGEHNSFSGTGTKLVISSLESTRSSSAPPPLPERDHWKKDKTGLSLKEKQDGADSNRQGNQEESPTEEKPKKRSVWKSILRRK